jgi:hypothetical protein
MLNNIAHKNPSTLNPGTNALTRSTMIPLMTNVNSPSVIIVTGRVKIIRIGLRIAFATPKTTATTTAVIKLETCTPGKTYAVITTARALRRSPIRILIH